MIYPILTPDQEHPRTSNTLYSVKNNSIQHQKCLGLRQKISFKERKHKKKSLIPEDFYCFGCIKTGHRAILWKVDHEFLCKLIGHVQRRKQRRNPAFICWGLFWIYPFKNLKKTPNSSKTLYF